MNQKDLYEKLTSVFREVFEDNSTVLTPDLTLQDIPTWDSLNNIRFIVAIEEAFSISLSALEVSDLKKVSEWEALIVSKHEQPVF